MSRWYYRIESNRRIKKYNTYNGKTDYFIQDAVKIEENKKIKFEKEYYQNGKESRFVNTGLSITLILFFIIYAIRNYKASNDIGNISIVSYSIDNSINIIGIILPFITSKPIARVLNPYFQLGIKGNKIYFLVVGTLLSILLAGILYTLDIGVPSTYILSMLGILITWIYT